MTRHVQARSARLTLSGSKGGDSRAQARGLLLEHQRDLIARAQAGDSRAEGEFLLSLEPYLDSLAYSFIVAAGLSRSAREDLVSEGRLACLVALRRFDSGRGIGFITFAQFRVRQAMYRWVARYRGAVTKPSEIHRRWANVDPATWNGAQVIGRTNFDSSLDARREGGQSLAENLADEASSSEDVVAHKEEVRLLEAGLAALEPRGRTIIIGKLQGKTQLEISKDYDRSDEWVRVKELEALASLRARLQGCSASDSAEALKVAG